MTSKNNRALLLYYVKLCASFQINWWIQTGFKVQKRSIRVEIGDMLTRVTLKFDGWPWKTIGHLFYATSSFVQHFVAIGEFKLELQSGNAQSGSNSTIFRAVRPWNLTDDLAKQWGTSSMLLQALCIISYPLVNSNLSYSPETLNSGQNRRFFLAVWLWNLTHDLAKTIGHLFYATSSFMLNFAAIGEFKLELQSGNPQFGSNSTIFRAVRPWN